MMFWIVAVLILLGAVGILAWPLIKTQKTGISRTDGGIEIYRQQLIELDRDVAEGLMAASDAEPLQLEIKRRILKIANRGMTDTGPVGGRNLSVIVAIVLLVPIASFALYADLGSPDQPAKPLALRDVEAEKRLLIGIQGADLVARLIEALKTQPDNLDGWLLLARTLSQMECYSEAAETFMKATILSPRDAGLYVGAGENYYFNAGGIVDVDAEQAFVSALSLDPDNPGARYYLALRDAQKGKLKTALDSWTELYKESPAEAPYMGILARRIEETAKETNSDIGDLLASKQPVVSALGPTREDLKDAANMSADERQQMILSMVSGLAERMAETPEYDGLIRLGQAYGTLEEYDKSVAAYNKAVELRPNDPAAMAAEAFAYVQAVGETQQPPKAAIEFYRKLLVTNPELPEALWYVGVAEALEGNKEAALTHWHRLQEIASKDGPLYATVTRAINSLSRSPEN